MALDVNDLMNELSSGSKWDTGVTFNRTNPVPIDKSSYFTHISAAENYALSGKTSYVGQQLFVLNADLSSADAYIIQDASGNLKKLDVSQHTLQKTIVTYDDGSVKLFDWSGELISGNINIAKGFGSIVDVKIGNAVTSIGEDAFLDCSTLTSVTIPNSVTNIKNQAFIGCRELMNVTIPDSVTNIEDSAFAHCNNLTSVTIGDSVTNIGEQAFYNCGLTGITIPDSVMSIGNNAFSGCRGLTSVTIPDSVTSIGNWAFSGCSGLTSVMIGDGVTSIGGLAFAGCTNLSTEGCVVFEGKQLSDVKVMNNHYWGLQLSNITTWNDASQEWVNNKVYDLTSNGISANTISAYNLSSNNISAQSISVNSFDLSIGSIISSYVKQSTISVLSVQDKLTVEGNLVAENDCYFGDSTTIHIGESNTLCTLLSDQFTPLSNAISSKIFTGTELCGGNYTDLSVIKISKEDYERKVVDGAQSGVDLSNNVLYIISSDYIDAYEQRIENVVMSNDNIPSEATNKHYVDSISSNLMNSINQLSTALSNDYALTSTLSGISAELSNSISSKIHYENLIDGISANIDLSITKLSPEQYEDKVVNNKIDDHTLYVVSANHLDAFGKTIKNITMTNDSIPSEAASQHFVENYVSAASNKLTNDVESFVDELSVAISSKVYVGNLQSGKYTDLSILKVTAHEYESIVVNATAGGVDLSNNVVYIVSADGMNMYGEKISNLTMTDDSIPSEATNKHYVDGSSRNALSAMCNGILSALSAADIIGKQQSEITFANVLSGMYFLVNYISSIQNSLIA